MESNNLPQIAQEDIFSAHFEQFQKSGLFHRLKKKFTPSPYYLRFKEVRLLTFLASYLFNGFSALTAATLVFFFLESLTSLRIISVCVTFTFLALLEFLKRTTTANFFKDLLQFKTWSKGLAGAVILLIGISISFSYFGAKRIVKEWTPAPTLLNKDSLTAPILANIASIEAQINDARHTKWKGTTTSTSQQTIKALTEQKTAVLSELYRITGRTDERNDVQQNLHVSEIQLKAEHFAGFTFLLELLFILCAYYLEFYDYRSFTEFARQQNETSTGQFQDVQSDILNIDTSTHDSMTKDSLEPENICHDKEDRQPNDFNFSLNMTDPNTIENAMRTIKNRIAAANYRLRNGIGRKETSFANLEHFTKELEHLERIKELRH